mgnify:CR=1 FL=1
MCPARGPAPDAGPLSGVLSASERLDADAVVCNPDLPVAYRELLATDNLQEVQNGALIDVLRVTGVILDSGRSLFVSDPTLLEGDAGSTEAVFEIVEPPVPASTVATSWRIALPALTTSPSWLISRVTTWSVSAGMSARRRSPMASEAPGSPSS